MTIGTASWDKAARKGYTLLTPRVNLFAVSERKQLDDTSIFNQLPHR